MRAKYAWWSRESKKKIATLAGSYLAPYVSGIRSRVAHEPPQSRKRGA